MWVFLGGGAQNIVDSCDYQVLCTAVHNYSATLQLGLQLGGVGDVHFLGLGLVSETSLGNKTFQDHYYLGDNYLPCLL